MHWRALKSLRAQLQAVGFADKLELPGLKEDRKPLLGAGLSVLMALFELLGIENLRAMDTGLRHGVLHDLIGRDTTTADLRSQSIERLARRFEVDDEHAQRVMHAALEFFASFQGDAHSSRDEHERHMRKLGWACQLHEVGTLISHSDSHKHSAYIIDHADVLGFSNNELHRLSLLVLGHRGKLKKLEADFDDVSFVQQLMSLRLAVLFCHARVAPALKGVQVQFRAASRSFEISVSDSWAQKYPQSLHLLQQESSSWQKTSWSLVLR
jgi:exopolyphosphatase/guanosine-5'-triphosphate,3'-diphosphate pyrophosphatase